MLSSTGIGTMTWSPLAGGILSGKYDDGVPIYSRAALKVYFLPIYKLIFLHGTGEDCIISWRSFEIKLNIIPV